MHYSKKDITFIIYNNRSPKLVEYFLLGKKLDINWYKLIKIEKYISNIKEEYVDNSRDLIFNLKDLNLNGIDLIYSLSDIHKLDSSLTKLKGIFSSRENKFLVERGLDVVSKNFLSLDKIIEYNFDLNVTGISIHPILTNILRDSENGGIVLPLYEGNKLVNLAIRRIGLSNNEVSKTLKYSLACPDIDIWGLDEIKIGDELWITEGIFDMYALKENGFKAVSVSSPHWSSIQLYRLLEKKPSLVNIFSDNDYTGIMSSLVMSDFLNKFSIHNRIYITEFAKDASEHFFEKKLKIGDLKNIDNNIYESIINDNFSYTDYLKSRKFK